MNLSIAVGNRFRVHGFVINSLPKAGTNLLAKAMRLLPGIRFARTHLDPRTLAQPKSLLANGVEALPVGVDWPRSVPIESVRRALARVRNGSFASMHAPHSDSWGDLMYELGMKTVLVIRDPRDVVVSHAHYVSNSPRHFLYDYYMGLPVHERQMVSIKGLAPSSPGAALLLDIGERCRSVMPWAEQNFNLVCRFEALVGAEGGGSRDEQCGELERVIQHLGIFHTSQDIERVADRLFGGTRTFRRGSIGGWRDSLTDAHLHAIKELAGQTLVDLGYEQDLDWQ